MMPRLLRDAFVFSALLGAQALPLSGARAQQRVVRVVGDDGQPVAFANVTFAGERPRITNERGEVPVGTGASTRFDSLTLDVRRLGYEPWYGRLAIGDTAAMPHVTLHRISRRMFTVTVTDSSFGVPAYLRGFYERMLARQRGIGNGLYLTPEEVDRRNANRTSALLQGLNGVSLQRTATGKIVAMNTSGSCQLTVLIDGHRACPPSGCDIGTSASSSTASPPPPGGPPRRGRTVVPRPPPRDEQFVLLDDLLGVNEVAAIEVYPRGATLPPSLPATSDASCGLIAIWTGGRKAP
jgi:hypothetical protein